MWKPVRGFEGLYEICLDGRVRRVARGKKFTAEQVNGAKALFAKGAELQEAADFLDTSITTAFNIKHGKTWAGDAAYRPVKTSAGRDFYLRFSACKNGAYTKVTVHRALWEAFNGQIPGRLEVNHKNLDRTDNRLENLELLTHRENVNHAHAIYAKERTHLPKGKRGGPRSKYAKLKHT
jgi:hypothetical protein